ncbi:Hsp70 family protein [Virgisporangium ochraceum]|uniref:Heat shock protein 70 n=1 Tax=Virgisporangium ochraceum TaxID=65505 RepID=A0A8J4A0S1_9ACTN|nr:Hsp70 family protein [Virgisporangium ochraceum]GIJ73694.1 hypothetical protein Voc01_086110 [Virgisporangium ochraceum]
MAGGYVLGVDFGTSNTAAVLHGPDGGPRPLLFDGVPQLPSAVFVAGATRLAGRDALHQGLARPAGLEPNPKRRVDDGTVLLSGEELPVAELVAVVLRRVREEATLAAGGPVGSLTLTCPAFWGPRRQSVLTAAARIAGLPEPVLVHEPVAAAAHYAAAHRSPLPAGRPVLVYDLGAGTCDATVVRRTPDGIDVVVSRGLDGVGGLDVDAAVVDMLAATVRPDDPAWTRLRRPVTAADLRARNTLWDGVRTAKEQLSRTASTYVYVPLLDAEVPLGREQFDALAGPVLARTVDLARAAVQDAGALTDLAAVLLVGGSSRLPLVASRLHRTLEVAPTLVDQPELAVALGSVTDVVRRTPVPPPVPDPVPVLEPEPVPEPARVSLEKAAPEPAAPPSTAPAPAPEQAAPAAPAPSPAPEPERGSPVAKVIGVLAILLVVVLIAGIAALVDRDADRDADRTGAGPTTSASPTPTPAATGPPGDLSIEKGSRQCRVGPVAPNLFFFDVQLVLRWSAPDGRPAPQGVVVELTRSVDGGTRRTVRYTFNQGLQPAGTTGSDDGYYRITGDSSLLGDNLVLTVTIDSLGAVTETDATNNTLSILTFMPSEADVGTGPGVQFDCPGI